MDLAKIVAELDDVIASFDTKWALGEGIKDHPEARHFVGNGHGWCINVIDYDGVVDGGAHNLRRGMAVHLTPALAAKAAALARKRNTTLAGEVTEGE